LKVTIKFFAHLKEEVGCDEEELELGRGASVSDLLEILRRTHHVLRGDEKLLVAVNGVRSKLDQRLAEGDIVALLPPVSGG